MDNCDCGAEKKYRELYCEKCKKEIENRFKRIMKENFEREEIIYLDEVLDGEWITGYVYGKEENK